MKIQNIIHTGDSRQILSTLPENSVDAIVTDPPYELGFMGKSWDRSGIANDAKFWHECLRVLKPGGHLLAFSGSRTYHRMTCAIEDAGFEVRDQMMWVYGSGFPKSMSVAKAVDSTVRLGGSNTRKLKQTEQETGGESYQLKGRNNGILGEEKVFERKEWEPVTEDGKKWDGWGTALKPAHEPICVARKPLDGTVAENIRKWGVGGLNIQASRVDGKRWPANLMHDGSEDVLGLFPGDANLTAARFFYCPKASKLDRDEGLEGFEERRESDRDKDDGVGGDNPRNRTNKHRLNIHPTVKPTELMRYLCRLVTPPGGTILDPFLGSGSTGKAAVLEGFSFIGIDLSAEYAEIAKARIDHALSQIR